MSSALPDSPQLAWKDLPFETRQLLTGKLDGLWGATGDKEAFDSLSQDKQRALLLLLQRLETKGLWHTVQRVNNVYGLGGVGMGFHAWPVIQSTLARRSDFTRRFARHRHTSGGFYEKNRSRAVLHFIFQEGNPRSWYVHFDLYSPVFSFASCSRHLRFEVLRKLKPDWRIIQECLKP